MFENLMTSFPSAPVVGVDVSGVDLAGLDALPRTSDSLVEAVTLVQWLLAHPADSLMTDYEVLEHAALWERVRTFSTAQVVASTVEFARRPEFVDADADRTHRVPAGQVARHYPVEEIAARLAISSFSADTHLNVGLTLAGRLGKTARAFSAGRLDFAKTCAIVDACAPVSDESAAAVEARVLDLAPDQDVTKLRQRVRRAVLRVDPAGAEDRRVRALADRRVWVKPTTDGMAWLTALLPAADALTIEKAIDAAARTNKADADPTDDRTLEQRRADLLVWPFRQALEHGALVGMTDVSLARHRGQRPQIQVTVAATTLQGLDDWPAELDGYGPITAQTARAIAAGGVWRRLLTDPASGAVLDVGTTTYRPPVDMARHVEIRDHTCRYPTCNRPATRGELDHTVPYPHGPTAAANLAVLCVRHHQLKHAEPDDAQRRPPRLVQSRPGTLRWTMPTGHQYVVTPPQAGDVRVAQSATASAA